MIRIKAEQMKLGQERVDKEIADFKTGRTALKPGCDALQSLESEVNGLLGKIRERCGQAVSIRLSICLSLRWMDV